MYFKRWINKNQKTNKSHIESNIAYINEYNAENKMNVYERYYFGAPSQIPCDIYKKNHSNTLLKQKKIWMNITHIHICHFPWFWIFPQISFVFSVLNFFFLICRFLFAAKSFLCAEFCCVCQLKSYALTNFYNQTIFMTFS